MLSSVCRLNCFRQPRFRLPSLFLIARVSKVVADLQQQAKSPVNEEFDELLDKVDEQSDAHAIISGLQLVAAEIARLREDLTDRIDSQASEN